MCFVHNCFIFTPIIMKLHTYRLPVSPGYALMIMGSKGDSHNGLITKNGFWCITAFPLHLQSSNFIHRFPVSPGYALMIMGSKGQGHNALITKNGFWCITAFPLHLQSSNFIHRFPVSPGYALMIMG